MRWRRREEKEEKKENVGRKIGGLENEWRKYGSEGEVLEKNGGQRNNKRGGKREVTIGFYRNGEKVWEVAAAR